MKHDREELLTYHSFSTPQEVDEWVMKSFTKEQLDSFDAIKLDDDPLADYKGNKYKKMNFIVRGGNTRYVSYHFETRPEDMEEGISAFDSIKSVLTV